jgi:hypothetical protein
MRLVFGPALRQTEVLIASVIGLPGLDLAVPDYSTLCRWTEIPEMSLIRGRRFQPA